MESRLRTLGAFELTIDGRPVARPSTQKARALLAYLVMRQGSRLARDEIVEAFWPEAEPDDARRSLRTALWSIRRAVRDSGADPDELLATDNTTVAWQAATTLDAAEFEARAAHGEVDAIELYRGDFLPGDYDLWTSGQRERLSAAFERLLAKSLEAAGGVGAAQRLLQLDPFNEAAYAKLIEAELAEQRTVVAQTLLTRFRAVLRENGLAASPAFDARFASLEAVARPEARRFIGRAKEQAAFENHLAETSAATIVVHGDAGYGKSALLARFRRRAAELGRRIVALAVAPEPSGFAGWERIYEDCTGERFEELVALRGTSVAGALAQAITDALPHGAVIFVDDAHRLRGDALFVTRAIAARANDDGITVVLATRPEGLEALLGSIGGAAARELPLAPFTAQEVRAAVPESGAAGETLARALYERTQGHPLFLDRVLERLQAEPGLFEMPASVRALLRARLRERGDDAFAVAGILALDRRFNSAALAALLEWPEERVLDACDDLLALGIVRESNDASGCSFSHDVVAEVALDALGPARRTRFHRLAAHLLEGETGVVDVVRAAEHNAAAGNALTAARLFARGAEAALAGYEPRNAAALAQRARRQLRSLEPTEELEALRLQIDLAEIKALNAAAEPEKAEPIASAAILVARRKSEPELLLELLLLRMRARLRKAALDDVIDDARAAMELAERLHDRVHFAHGALGIVNAAVIRLNERDALTYSRLALAAALESEDVDAAIFAAVECIHAQIIFWKFDGAMETLACGERLMRSGSGGAAPNFYHGTSMLMYQLNRFEEADRAVDRGLQVLEERRVARAPFTGDRLRSIAILTNMRATIAVACRRWDAAVDAAEEFAKSPAAQNAGIRPHALALHARALLGRGRLEDVERAAALLAGLDGVGAVDDAAMYVDTARALLAARRCDPAAASLIDSAIDCANATAERAGLDADAVFADLAEAAAECGAQPQFERAAELRDHYFGLRRAAAGVHWGGR